MRILLVNPSLIKADVGHYSKVIEKKRGVYPPLGLAYVAAALEEVGHVVKIVDCDADLSALDNVGEIACQFNPVAVGIYVMTWTFLQANEIVAKIKKRLPDVKFVMGGPNVTSFPEKSLKYSEFDYAVYGEGEITVVELARAIEKDVGVKDLKKIRGIIFRDGVKIVVNETRPLIEDLDSISFPAWHLLPLGEYFDIFTRHARFATMVTSRGCPFDCAYCDRLNRMGKTWRSRSAENIVDEMEFLVNTYGIREFMFFDDNFIIDAKRVYALCDEILSRGLDVLWEVRARVDMVDEPLLKRMREAGCYRIRYGMEVGDDQVLKTLKKDITVEQIRHASKITKEAGIEIFAYFMMGSPGESRQTLQKTLDLAIEIDPDFVAFSKTILIIGSELFDWGVREKQISPDYWEKFLLGEEKDPAPGISTEILPQQELDEFVSTATSKFYFRPNYILKRITNIRSPTQFLRQIMLGFNLFYSKASKWL